MWSTPSLYIVIFILFGFLSLSLSVRFSYSISQIYDNGKVYFIYNGQNYDTITEVMKQVQKDRDEYFKSLNFGPSVIYITRYPNIRPIFERTTLPPSINVEPVSKVTQPPRPTARPFSRNPEPQIVTEKPAPRPTIPPKTAKPGVTQAPPNNRIDPMYIPNPDEVDNLYTFDVNVEKKKKSSGPFSERVYDEVWNGYDYKKDYKTGYLDMRDRILEETNRYREAHGVEPLTYDYDLEKASQEYAKYLGDRNLFDHDPKNKPNGWGENLAKMSASLGSLATKKWYDEVSMYDFVNNRYVPGTGHFTALVWKETTKVGCGIYMKNEILYVVCKYTPRGNMRNDFYRNVFKRLPQYN